MDSFQMPNRSGIPEGEDPAVTPFVPPEIQAPASPNIQEQIQKNDQAQKDGMLELMSRLMQEMSTPQEQQYTPAQINASIQGNPATMSEFSELFGSMLVDGNPEYSKTPKAPVPVGYEQGAQEARERAMGKTAQEWQSAWQLPRQKKVAELSKYRTQSKVNLDGLKDPVLDGLYDLQQLASRNGYQVLIESAMDGKHSENSYHYHGEAIDVNFLKDGKPATYDKKARDLFKTWAWQAGFATMYDEAHYYDEKGNMGAERPGAHFHLAWGNDAEGSPGAFQLHKRNRKDPNYLKRMEPGKKTRTVQSFADVQPLLESHDMRTPVGKTVRVAELSGVNPRIFSRLIQKESNFQFEAVNPESGARGYGQIMPDTARWAAQQMKIDPNLVYKDEMTHLKTSAWILKNYANQFDGNYALGLAAYNWGPGNVQEYLAGRRSLPAETRDYVYSILKDELPNQLKNPKDVDALLKNRGGITLQSQIQQPKINDEQKRALITPWQRTLSYFGDLVHGKTVTRDKNAPAPKGEGTDFISTLLKAGDESVDDLVNTMANFAKHAVPLGLMPDLRRDAREAKSAEMQSFLDEYPGLLKFGYNTATRTVPWLTGTLANFFTSFGAVGKIAGAAKGAPVLGPILGRLGGVASAEMSNAPLALQYMNRLRSGGAEFVKDVAALGGLLSLNQAGTSMMDWFWDKRDGRTDMSFDDAIKKAGFDAFLAGTLGTLTSLAAPVGMQVGLSSVVRSPQMVDDLGRYLNSGSRESQLFKRGTAGAVSGVVTSQLILNPILSAFGFETLTPGEGAGLGAGASVGLGLGSKVSGAVSDNLAKIGLKQGNPVYDLMRGAWNKSWDTLDDTYKSAFTSNLMDAMEVIKRDQAITVKREKANFLADHYASTAEAIESPLNAVANDVTQRSQRVQQTEAGAMQAEQTLEQARQQLGPAGEQAAALYVQQLQAAAQAEQNIAKLQAASANAGGNDKGINQQLKEAQKLLGEAKQSMKDIQKSNPLAVEFSGLQAKVADIQKKAQFEKAQHAEFLKTVEPSISKGQQFVSTLKSESDRIRNLPPEVFEDPAFRLGQDSEFKHLKYDISDIPEYFKGADRDLVAKTWNETFVGSILSSIDQFDQTGKFFDQETFIRARQYLRDVTSRYGPLKHDAAVVNAIESYQQAALRPMKEMKYEIFEDKISAAGKYAKESLEEQILTYDPSRTTKAKRGKANSWATVHPEVIIAAAKKQGIALDDPAFKARVEDIIYRGTRSRIDSNVPKLEPGSVDFNGQTFIGSTTKKRTSAIREFGVNEETAALAVAARQMGDTAMPVSIPQGGSADFNAWTNLEAERHINNLQKYYADTAVQLKTYGSELHSQDIVKSLHNTDENTKLPAMGEAAVLNERLDPNQILLKAYNRAEGTKLDQADIPAELIIQTIESTISQKGSAYAQNYSKILSDEIRMIASIGEDFSGAGASTLGAAAKMANPEQTVAGVSFKAPIKATESTWIGFNEGNLVLVDADGKVVNRKVNYYVPGAERQLSAMELSNTVPSSGILKAKEQIIGRDNLAFVNNGVYMSKVIKDEVDRLSTAGGLKSEDVVGHMQTVYGRDNYSLRKNVDELAHDVEFALSESITSNYQKYAEANKSAAEPQKTFIRSMLDAVEDYAKFKPFIQKYGEHGKQALVDYVTAVQGMSGWKVTDKFLQDFARESFALHIFPRQQAFKSAQRGSDVKASQYNTFDFQSRKINTLSEADELYKAAQKEVSNTPFTEEEFIHMGEDERAAALNPDQQTQWENLSEKDRNSLRKKANSVAQDLLLKVDDSVLDPAKLVSTRLRTMGHAAGVRQMLSTMMDTPLFSNNKGKLEPRKLLEHRSKDNPAAPQITVNGKPEYYKRLTDLPMFSNSHIKMKGKEFSPDELWIHPEAYRFLSEYASKADLPSPIKMAQEFNRITSNVNLLGSFIPHMLNQTMQVMGDIMEGFFTSMAPGVFNYSGAGKAIRENAKNGRLLELFAIRNGLNTSHLYHNTAMITTDIIEMMGEDYSNKLLGVGDNKVKNFFYAVDPRNPNRQAHYDALPPFWQRVNDVFSTPFHIEQAMTKNIMFSHIRDAQLAAFYARSSQMYHSSPELLNIKDPMERMSLAMQAASAISNKDAGSMPYYLFNKHFREAIQTTVTVPGWGMTIAHNVLDVLGGVLGLGNNQLRKVSPSMAEALDYAGRKLVGGKPLYANLDPEVRQYVRDRMARTLAGLAVASVAGTELFNVLVNGQSSFLDPDPKRWAKLRVGDTWYSGPFFGSVKSLVRLMTGSVGYFSGKQQDSFLELAWSEIQGRLNPAFEEIAVPLLSRGSGGKVAAAEEAAVEGSVVKRGARMLAKTFGGQEVMGFKRDADPSNVARGLLPFKTGDKIDQAQVKASQLTPEQYLGRVVFGISDSKPNIPNSERGRFESKMNGYRTLLNNKVENLLKAATTARDQKARDEFLRLAQDTAATPLEIKDPSLRKYQPFIRMSPEAFQSLRAKYFTPATHSISGADRADKQFLFERFEEYKKAGIDPMSGLIPMSDEEEK